MYLYFKKDTIFASKLYAIYNGSPLQIPYSSVLCLLRKVTSRRRVSFADIKSAF